MSGEVCIRRPGATWTSCTCTPCRRDKARVTALHRMGRIRPAPSARAWAVVDHLVSDLNWTRAAVASACGVSERTIAGGFEHRAAGRRHAWTRPTARAILTRQQWPTVGQIGVLGTTRRLQALAALGWTIAEMSGRSGLAPMTISVLRSGLRSRRVNADVAATVRDLYDTLSMRPGPSTVAAAAAARDGWVPPLAWDDDTIDDPKAKPYRTTKREQREAYRTVDEIAIERALAGDTVELTQAEREIAVERLARDGFTDGQIADRIGVWAETVLRTRRRLGIESRWVA